MTPTERDALPGYDFPFGPVPCLGCGGPANPAARIGFVADLAITDCPRCGRVERRIPPGELPPWLTRTTD